MLFTGSGFLPLLIVRYFRPSPNKLDPLAPLVAEGLQAILIHETGVTALGTLAVPQVEAAAYGLFSPPAKPAGLWGADFSTTSLPLLQVYFYRE